MKRIDHASAPANPQEFRCAIYTRKSTDEGLDKEFNSLDAQRDAGESFIRSQAGERWICLPDRYDDGGYTGGNMNRPALQRLISDIESGRINVVVVYKVDRLSRNLFDFCQMIQIFEKHHVSFVSITQSFNTATSMGRLILHVLLSFAQFEREINSERTRDKIAATRRKGKWAGGHPILGYDVDPNGFRLLVNDQEAERVRAIFKLYLEHESLLSVVVELNKRGWVNKRWQTRKGRERGGKIFTRTNLHKLLTNIAYTGKVRYKDEVHNGEHRSIVDSDVWEEVQAVLERNRVSGGAHVRNKFGALLKGVIRCVRCGCAMTPSHSTRRSRRYRYYVCCRAQKLGWDACPSKSVPAAKIEQLVIQQIRSITTDACLFGDVTGQEKAENKLALSILEPAWSALTVREQILVIRQLVEHVEYDGVAGKVKIAVSIASINALAHGIGKQVREGVASQDLILECDVRATHATRPEAMDAERTATPARPGRIPRVARLMALAIRFAGLLKGGEITSYADLASLGHVTRARVSQIMNLLQLAPDIQEEILHLPPTMCGRDPIRLAQLQPIASVLDWRRQRPLWHQLRSVIHNGTTPTK